MTSLRYGSLPATHGYASLLSSEFGLTLTNLADETERPFRGHVVHVDRYAPVGASRGTVIFVHGAGGNGRLLAPFAPTFRELGFEVMAPDLPGYGLTRVCEGETPDYASWIDLLVEMADEAAMRGPVILFGLSVGGMTACRVAERAKRIDGVIVTTLVDLSDARTFDRLARARILGALARFAFRFLPRFLDRLALPLKLLTPLATLTTSRALQRMLLDDPLLGRRRVPLGFFRSLHGHRAPPPNLPCPLLVVHPGADTWTPTAMTRAVFERVRAPRKSLVELPNGAHAPLEHPAFDALCGEVRAFVHSL